MKKLLLCIVATVATFACSNAQKNEFTEKSLSQNLIDTENNKVLFSDILKKHGEKVTVIEIWASWCSDCVKAMPKVKEMQKNFPGADYVFISMDKNFDSWKKGIATHELKGDHYWAPEGMKGEFGKSIDVDWIPRYIVIGKNSEVLIYKAIETDFAKINEQLKTSVYRNANLQKADNK